ncbi:MAG TPA: hypothetical protein PLL34_08400, partial [Candidatus Mcinerneyibacteriales bacterium]|nr:hypothetical protein [Candidatus Mcinerneyibacteriales bacterium]
MKKVFDTIAAPLTVRGEAAVSLIRISGPDALSVVAEVFKTRSSLNKAPARKVILGDIVDGEGH